MQLIAQVIIAILLVCNSITGLYQCIAKSIEKNEDIGLTTAGVIGYLIGFVLLVATYYYAGAFSELL